MKNKIILIFSIILCVHYFCNAQRDLSKEEQDKYYPNKKRKFTLAKRTFALTDTSIITTSAVYVNERPPIIVQEKYTTYFFFRFFSDGRMFISHTYKSYPSIEEFNDLSYGENMRYIIEDGGRIKMEVVGNYNKLRFIYGRSYGDKIVTYVTRRDWKKDRPQPRSVYQKRTTKFYN